MKQRGWALLAKRAVDRAGAMAGLLVFFPVIGGTALAIGATLGRPVFFVQERPGKDGKPFQLVKFRTMTSALDEHGQLLPDAQRLSRVGQIARSASIDELPQLWNVLVGDMSLVGPRPLLTRCLLYTSPSPRD